MNFSGEVGRRRFLSLLLLVAAGCGGGATNGQYAGAPLTSLHGQLLASTSFTQTAPVLLSIAWYPEWATGGPAAPLKAIVPQAAPFQGSFPIDFTFNLYTPPPSDALADLSINGGSGRIAYGVLIAYEDRNGNGQLDTIAAQGIPVDKIVGVSVGDPSMPPPRRSYFVTYLDGTIGPDDYFAVFGLEQGYNLVEQHNNFGVQRVPSDHALSVTLTGTDALDVFACEEEFETLNSFSRACGIDPYAGKNQLQGDISSSGGIGNLWVINQDGFVGDATVTLDGVPIPSSGPSTGYLPPLVDAGANEIDLAIPGAPSETIAFVAPDPIVITSPLPDQRLRTGSPISLTWQSTPGAEEYDVFVIGGSDTSPTYFFHELTTGTSSTIPPISASGDLFIDVKALGTMAVGSNGSFLTAFSSTPLQVVVEP